MHIMHLLEYAFARIYFVYVHVCCSTAYFSYRILCSSVSKLPGLVPGVGREAALYTWALHEIGFRVSGHHLVDTQILSLAIMKRNVWAFFVFHDLRIEVNFEMAC